MEENNLIKDLPGAYYFPNWITTQEAENLIQDCSKLRGSVHGITTEKGPLVSAFGSIGNTKPLNLPNSVNHCLNKLIIQDIIEDPPPMQISVNQYPSNYQLLPHKDGSGCGVIILSLKSYAVLNFYHDPSPEQIHITIPYPHNMIERGYNLTTNVFLEPNSVLVLTGSSFIEPNSVLVLTGSSFIDYVHGISLVERDIVKEENFGNFHLLNNVKDGDVFARQERISIAIWMANKK